MNDAEEGAMDERWETRLDVAEIATATAAGDACAHPERYLFVHGRVTADAPAGATVGQAV